MERLIPGASYFANLCDITVSWTFKYFYVLCIQKLDGGERDTRQEAKESWRRGGVKGRQKEKKEEEDFPFFFFV